MHLFGGFLVVSILPTWCLGQLLGQRWADSELRHATLELGVAADRLNLKISHELSEQTKLVETLIDILQPHLEQPDVQRALTDFQATHSQFIELNVVQRNGTCLSTTLLLRTERDAAIRHCEASATAVHQQVIEYEKIEVLSDYGSEPSVLIVVPMEGQNWELEAYILAKIRSTTLVGDQVDSSLGDRWLLGDAADRVLATSPQHPQRVGTRFVRTERLNGEPVSSVTRQVTARPRWTLTVSRSEATIRASAGEVARIMTAGIAIAILVCMILAWIVATLLSRPIRRIAEVAAHIGHGNLTREPADPAAWTPKEIATLTTDVRSMVRMLRRHVNDLEETVDQRTEELTKTIEELERAQGDLVIASRQAGQAEVAIGVLHNVGNVLNSVNVASRTIEKTVANSSATHLKSASALLEDHASDLSRFFTTDERGKRLPQFLRTLATVLEEERAKLREQVATLAQNIEHITSIVQLQQSYARHSDVSEKLAPNELVEDALRLFAGALEKDGIELSRSFENLAPVLLDRHRVLQILVNLVSNAKHAIADSDRPGGILSVETRRHDNQLEFRVKDNGVGISEDLMHQIFQHGFTTKENGHGFGLHMSSISATEMGGKLFCHSEGSGKGSTFTLALPLAAPESKALSVTTDTTP